MVAGMGILVILATTTIIEYDPKNVYENPPSCR